MQRMPRREARARLDVGEHDRADALGERDTSLKIVNFVRGAADHDQRPARAVEQARGLEHEVLRRVAGAWCRKTLEGRQRNGRCEMLFLQCGVETYVHW